MAETPTIPAAKPAKKKKMKNRPRIVPALLRREDAAVYCGVSASTWDRWTASGDNPEPNKKNGAVLWSRHELAEWCRRGCPPRDEWVHIWAAILDR